MFTIGYNTPGYLPQSDDPHICDDADSAREAMLAELDRHADHVADGSMDGTEGGDATVRLVAQYETLMAELRTCDIDEGWSATVADASTDSHDLGTHYWITPCETAMIDVTIEGWRALAETARESGTILTFTDGEDTWQDPLRCPECHGTNVTPPQGHKLAKCDTCGIAYDTMD